MSGFTTVAIVRILMFSLFLIGLLSGSGMAAGEGRRSDIRVDLVADIPVSKSNVNLFATSLAYYKGSIYTVNVEEGDGEPPAIGLNTVVRKYTPTGVGEWHGESYLLEPHTIDDPYHTQASIAVDRLGYIHVAYNMHNMPWQYAVSSKPGDISGFKFLGDYVSLEEKYIVRVQNKTPFPSIGTAAIPGNQITYPSFFYDRKGELFVTYRFATRPKRAFKDRGFAGGIAKYDINTKTWAALGGEIPVTHEDADLGRGKGVGRVRAFAFTDNWSVYLIRMAFDDANRMHISWLWREGGAGRDTSRPSYAFSPDGGKTFYSSKGQKFALPIQVGEADIIVQYTADNVFSAKSSIETDRNLTPYIITHSHGRPRALVFFDQNRQEWSEPEPMPHSAPLLFIDDDGHHWAFATGPVVFLRDAPGKPWEIVYKFESDVKYGYPRLLKVRGERKIFLHAQSTTEDSVKIFQVSY